MTGAAESSPAAALLVLAATGRPRPAIDYALDLIDGGMTTDRLIVEVLAGVQREVGRRWQANEWSVAQEHAVTAVIDGVLGAVSLQRHTSASPDRGSVLVACVEGEYHSLPARMGSERLRYDGWDVTFLGASVPAHDLQRYVVDASPEQIVLSCTLNLVLPGAARCISALADLGSSVAVAGAAFGDTAERAARLGASAWIGPGTDASEVLAGQLVAARSVPLAQPESTHLELHSHELVEACMIELSQSVPSMGTYSTRQLSSTRQDLAYILRYVALAVALEETDIFEDFASWLAEVLSSRAVPPDVLVTSFAVVGDVLLGAGLERSAALCRSGLERVNG